MNYVTSKEASKILGLHPNTLRYYADNGIIESFRTNSGHRRYNVESYLVSASSKTGLQKQSLTLCYCRVSSPKQRVDLEKQVKFMQSKYPGAEVVKDIGSGLNYKRKGLRAILERAMRGEQLEVVVAHRDRLVRFGFELIEWIIQQSGGKVVDLKQNDLSPEQELTNELLSIIHLFSSRIDRLRNYKNQIRQALSKSNVQKVDQL